MQVEITGAIRISVIADIMWLKACDIKKKSLLTIFRFKFDFGKKKNKQKESNTMNKAQAEHVPVDLI